MSLLSAPHALTSVAALGVQMTLVTLGFVCFLWVAHRTLNTLASRFAATRNRWDDTMVKAARPVVMLAVVFVWAALCYTTVTGYFEIDHSAHVSHVRRMATIVLLYVFLMRYLRLFQESLHETDRPALQLDRATAELLVKLMQITLTVAMLLTLLQNLGVSIGSLLAFGGVGGLAVGLAAKDMLANLFGGLTLYMDRPFVVGDKVQLKDKGVEGFVEKIGWRQTRIRGYDRTPVYVPNALFTNMAVVNPSRMQNRLVSITIGLRYQDFAVIEEVTEAMEKYMASHSSLDKDRGVMAKFTDYGDSSLNILVRFYTVTTDWKTYMKARHEVLLDLGRIIHELGADIAFPTRTLEIAQPAAAGYPEPPGSCAADPSRLAV